MLECARILGEQECARLLAENLTQEEVMADYVQRVPPSTWVSTWPSGCGRAIRLPGQTVLGSM